MFCFHSNQVTLNNKNIEDNIEIITATKNDLTETILRVDSTEISIDDNKLNIDENKFSIEALSDSGIPHFLRCIHEF